MVDILSRTSLASFMSNRLRRFSYAPPYGWSYSRYVEAYRRRHVLAYLAYLESYRSAVEVF